TEIVSFLPTSYTYRTDPQEINSVWKNRSQEQDLDAFLLPFGYGDGGGGPARDYIEYVKREADLEGMAKVKMAGPMEFFEDCDKAGGPVNTYVGELYFSAHRGTYTSQAKVKANNRKCEIALREMEIWSALALLKGKEYGYETASDLWKELLLHQFHDILPGSSIKRVYEEAEERVGNVIARGTELAETAAKSLTEQSQDAITVFNSLAFPRKELVTLPEQFADGARTTDGEKLPVYDTDEGYKALVEIPSVGAVSLVPERVEKAASGATVNKTGEGFLLENDLVQILIDESGEVRSYVLKETGREFVKEPMNHFRLYKDVPRLFDAWDIDSNYIEQEIEAAKDIKVEIVGSGVEAVLKVTGKISESIYEQRISLAKDSARLEFKTTVDWRELHRLLKVSFPVDVYAENGINEMQFGYVERPTHRSRSYDKDRFEVCNHKYSALVDMTHGAAVLNDCKYGISMNGNALELTLLRAAACPDMRADNRKHTFTYAFLGWEGAFVASDVTKEAYALNVKPLAVPGTLDTFSMFSADKENIFMECCKPAEDESGDVILRLYEAKKAATSVKIHLGFGRKAYLCDMLENVLEEIRMEDGNLSLSFGAFEIKTIRVKK
ncbi:MAG: alpha-mannosidase, partial [Acetatifactor sp.]|nr:alpha-mannosidase [Acetatifactor sp.]